MADSVGGGAGTGSVTRTVTGVVVVAHYPDWLTPTNAALKLLCVSRVGTVSSFWASLWISRRIQTRNPHTDVILPGLRVRKLTLAR